MNALKRYYKDIKELKPKAVTERDKLVEGALKLAAHIARKYKTAYPLEDRIQAGNLGLLRAAENYDPTRGIAFTTYAMYYVRAYIRSEILYQGAPIRIPRTEADNNSQLTMESFLLDFVQRFTETPKELNYINSEAVEVNREIETLLSDKERYVVYKYVCERRTFSSIAEEFGMTHQAIHLIYHKALAKLRQSKKLKTLYEEA